jgi:pimeloyl-ACP methyl ester carboxylesterase
VTSLAPRDGHIDLGDGVRLHTRTWPGDAAPPLLLVHGLASNARLWDGVAARLSAAGWPSVAVDLRAHGDSDAPPDGYDTVTAAGDLAGVLDRLAIAPVVAAGQSWGGNVVAALAAARPDLVAALALLDGGWLDLTVGFASWAECAAALRPPEVDGVPRERIRRMLARAHPDWSAEAVDATVYNLRLDGDDRLYRRMPVDRHMMIVRSMWDRPPWVDLAAIGAPTLLMPAGAAGDPRRAQVRRAAEVLASARISDYAGADHDLHAQHPARVAEDLLALAREVAR